MVPCASMFDPRAVEPLASVAEELPALYRDVLDALADLERRGDRTIAIRLRREALATYALPWDAETQRKLEHLRGRIDGARRQALSGPLPPRPRGLRLWRRRAGEAGAR